MHLLCMCSMLVPSEFSHLRKLSAKKMHVRTFLGNCRISESAKKLQKLFGSAPSHLRICCFFDFGPGDCSGGLQDAEIAYIRRPPIKVDFTTFGCRLGLTLFAFRLTFGFLLILGSLIGSLGIRSSALRLCISLLRGWLHTVRSRRLLSARTGTSLEIV